VTGPLAHLRVIELASDLGAYAGRLLAELGAEVIKLEPRGGDPARRVPPFPPQNGAAQDAGLPWLAWNAGKRSVELDLGAEAGRAAARGLIARADIFLVSADRHGLPAYQTLANDNAALIEVCVLARAETGDRYGRAASDLTLMAESGLMTIIGDPDRPPLTLPGAQAYALAGVQGVIAALLALHARRANGRGRRALVSAYQAAVLANYREPVVWAWEGRIGARTGNRLIRGGSGVRQVWPCRDGYITWSLVDNPGMIRGMVALLRAEGLGAELAAIDWDNTLVANAPQADIDRWEIAIGAYFARHTGDELAALSTERGLGLSRIETPAHVRESAQERARAFWRRIEDQARALALSIPGPLFLSSLGFEGPATPAPRLGEANGEFLPAPRA
jgi:crotonobetainyl-CoA:carnitine CoA-transferase CaiB-like acyl-CoA transferase